MTSTAWYAHTDAGLLDRAEHGDEAAFTALYRRYYAATRRLAYTYLQQGNPDDVVDATFAEVVDGLRAHRRPGDSFVLHAFATVRRLVGERPGAAPGVMGPVPPAVAAVANRQALGGTDRATITAAFSALSERWQVVVWHMVLDRCDQHTLAQRLSVSPSAAAVQAQRAGIKLRQAYLEAHLREAPRPGCYPHRERLAALHRRALSPSDDAATRQHLDRCDSCRNLVDDFDQVEDRLAWAVAPLFPFAAAPGASSPLALGTAGMASAGSVGGTVCHDSGSLAAIGGPQPFRSHTGPRHIASSAYGPDGMRVLTRRAAGRHGDGPHDEWAAGDGFPDGGHGGNDHGWSDDTYADDEGPEHRRPPFATFAVALAVVLLLVGGIAAGMNAFSSKDGDEVGIETTGDVTSPEGLPADRPDGPQATRDAESTTTAEAPSTTSPGVDGDTTTTPRPRRPSSSSSSSSSTAPDTTGAPSTSATAPPTTAPYTSAPATTTALPPAPQLVLYQPEWRLIVSTQGLLTVGVRRPSSSVSAMAPPSGSTVTLRVDVTAGVRLSGRLDRRCDATTLSSGTTVTCEVDPPDPGRERTLSLGLVVAGLNQHATITATQDGAGLGSQTADLLIDSDQMSG